MTRNIYAIYDLTADDIIGGLQLYSHDAPAIRMFQDVANISGGVVALHLEEFNLVQLGTIQKDHLDAALRIVVTGKALQTARENNANAR